MNVKPTESDRGSESEPERYEGHSSSGQVGRSSSGHRLQRETSFEQEVNNSHSSETFGVKSYLHHFYAPCPYKDPSVYDDEDDFRYLLHSDSKRRPCTSVWWKAFVALGVAFLAFGDYIGI